MGSGRPKALKQARTAGVEVLCEELGLSLQEAFTVFARKMVREHRIPFEVSLDPFYPGTNLKSFRVTIAQVRVALPLIDSRSWKSWLRTVEESLWGTSYWKSFERENS